MGDKEADFTGIAPTLKHVKHLENLCNMILDLTTEEIDGRWLGIKPLFLCGEKEFSELYEYVLRDILNFE